MILRKIKRFIGSFLGFFGIYPIKFINNIRGLFSFYIKDFIQIKKQINNINDDFKIERIWPILYDKYDSSGTAKGDYFHQDLLVARKIYENNPPKHLDIGSRVDGFVAHVASFREIYVLDIRPLDNKIDNIIFSQADLMNLPIELENSYESVSCLHALEHFGLGRYGDPIDIEGHKKGFLNISKILKKNGVFYFSVPIGKSRIEFNAHRVFSISYILDMCEGLYSIESFSYVDDKGDLHKNIDLDKNGIESNFGCNYGCGIFELRKL